MVNKSYKCIFVAVPKTGSKSIREIVGHPKRPHLDILEIKSQLEQWFPYEDLKSYEKYDSLYQRALPSVIKKKLGNAIFSKYFKFGFVRNPWSRTVSLYLRKQGIQMRDKMTFDEFVNWIQYSSDTCKHPSQKKNQLDWFTNEMGEVGVDYIGKFETLNKDWDYISNQLGIQQPLPHLNLNAPDTRKHYTEYYTTKSKELIQQKFKVDIEYFGYDFEK